MSSKLFYPIVEFNLSCYSISVGLHNARRAFSIERKLRSQAFFWTFRKKLKAKKSQAKKNSSKFSKNSSKSFTNSIICQVKTDFFAQKSPEVGIFCTKNCPNISFSTNRSLKLGKFREFWKNFPFF